MQKQSAGSVQNFQNAGVGTAAQKGFRGIGRDALSGLRLHTRSLGSFDAGEHPCDLRGIHRITRSARRRAGLGVDETTEQDTREIVDQLELLRDRAERCRRRRRRLEWGHVR